MNAQAICKPSRRRTIRIKYREDCSVWQADVYEGEVFLYTIAVDESAGACDEKVSAWNESKRLEVEPLSGWGKPDGAHCFHFFFGSFIEVQLESACSSYYEIPWLWDVTQPLAQREPHADGNCMGCRAWLSIPANRLSLETVSSA